jgi:hypothetical protein
VFKSKKWSCPDTTMKYTQHTPLSLLRGGEATPLPAPLVISSTVQYNLHALRFHFPTWFSTCFYSFIIQRAPRARAHVTIKRIPIWLSAENLYVLLWRERGACIRPNTLCMCKHLKASQNAHVIAAAEK